MQYKQIFGLLLIFTSIVWGSENEAEYERKKSPDFSAKTLIGKNYTLSKNVGSGPIVINFWATWCTPCALEMEAMKTLFEKYNSKGVAFVSISTDDVNSTSQVQSVVRSRKYPFIILLDPNKLVNNRFNVTNIPQTLIVDNEGYIVYEHNGYRKGDEAALESALVKSLEIAQ